MQAEKRPGIYYIENKMNGKKYIGRTVNVYNRWASHINDLKHHRHYNQYLQELWDEYGPDVLDFVVIEYCSEEELDDKEVCYISLYNTLDREYGYNLQTGGHNRVGYGYGCEESKQKQSEAIKKSFADPERKRLQSESLRKLWATPEYREKLSGENNGMYGKRHTEEALKKMSEAAKGRVSPKRLHVSVLCVELNKKYEWVADAAKEFGLNSTSIIQVCQGIRKTLGGYHWQFLSENNI